MVYLRSKRAEGQLKVVVLYEMVTKGSEGRGVKARLKRGRGGAVNGDS